MSKEIVKEEITRLLETIVEQTQTIDAYKGKIPQIEIDLIQDNIRHLYQDFMYLDRLNHGDSVDVDITKTKQKVSWKASEKKTEDKARTESVEDKKETLEKQEEQEKEKSEEQTETLPEEESAPEEVLKGEEKKATQTVPKTAEKVKKEGQPTGEEKKETEEKEESKTEEKPRKGKKSKVKKDQPEKEKVEQEGSEKHEEKTAEKGKVEHSGEEHVSGSLFDQGSTSTLADKLNTNEKSINDRLSGGQKQGTLGERLKKKPVEDIKGAIGINEKFLFINELFGGNMHDYNDAIKRLNRAGSLEDAASIFDELAEKYNWEKEAQSTLQLLDFVERRYMQ